VIRTAAPAGRVVKPDLRTLLCCSTVITPERVKTAGFGKAVQPIRSDAMEVGIAPSAAAAPFQMSRR
jgi:hypothetical protein